MSRGHHQGWIGLLRRERVLFAAIGACLLILNTSLPIAAGQAASPGAAGVICGLYDPADHGVPGQASLPECPLCFAGHKCGVGMVSAKALPASDEFVALRPDHADRAGPKDADAVLAARTDESPPAIRAPPPA